MYRQTTRAIQVTVEPNFIETESSPEEGQYFWAYRIEISNLGEEVVRLRSRHWRITDAAGRQHEVRGPGVVGEQPVLKPGACFEYTSGTPLATPFGILFGTYEMETDGGEKLEVSIPAFSLDCPFGAQLPN